MRLFGPVENNLPPSFADFAGLAARKTKRVRSAGSCFALAVLSCLTLLARGGTIKAATIPDDGLRIELPSSNQIRVENKFGDVFVQVQKDRDVSVAATVSGAGTLAHSPVTIEKRNDLLLISVARVPSDSLVRVSLTVGIPEAARAEIVTGDGEINSRGLSASMSLNTISGNIHAEVALADADIIARSNEGAVRSELLAPLESDPHSFRSRIGEGRRVFRANSQRGEIIVSSAAEVKTASSAPQLRSETENRIAAGTPASQKATEEVDEGDVVRVDAQLVTMNLNVVDRATNKGMIGLTQADFRLFEDGAEQRIVQFDSASAPFDLVLVIDLSGSTREVVKLIRAAAQRFVDAARPSDRISVITFAGRPVVVSPLTLDREQLRKGVAAIDTLHGDTKLYDATDFAIAEVTREARKSRRTAIVLMSDGLDGSIQGVNSSNLPDAGSKISYKELLNTVREFDGVVYTLWLDTYYEALNAGDTQPEAFDTGHDRMEEIAEAGGGAFYEVERLEDLAGAYERVVADLGTMYSLAYRPSNKTRDGQWRTIRVAVDRSNAVPRGKHGYYAN